MEAAAETSLANIPFLLQLWVMVARYLRSAVLVNGWLGLFP